MENALQRCMPFGEESLAIYTLTSCNYCLKINPQGCSFPIISTLPVSEKAFRHGNRMAAGHHPVHPKMQSPISLESGLCATKPNWGLWLKLIKVEKLHWIHTVGWCKLTLFEFNYIFKYSNSFDLESVHLAKTISTLVVGSALPWTSQEAFG